METEQNSQTAGPKVSFFLKRTKQVTLENWECSQFLNQLFKGPNITNDSGFQNKFFQTMQNNTYI